MTEHGYAVRPRSTAAVIRASETFLRRVAPSHLTSGHALDLGDLVDYRLQREGIMVYSVSSSELPDSEAETRAGSGQFLEILVREEFYDAIFERNQNSNRARSTLAHEIGHAVLHSSELRTGRLKPHALALRRARRSELKPFRDSEWQAHTFAGGLLIPLTALRMNATKDVTTLADQFGVSDAFVLSHLKRIKRIS